MGEIFGVPNKSLPTFFECQPFKSRSLSLVCVKGRVFLMQELILSQIALVILKESLVFRKRLNYTQANDGARVEPRTS